MWLSFLAVILGAAIGATLRWLISIWLFNAAASWSSATLVVNLVGAYVIGLLFVYCAQTPQLSAEWRLFWITGSLGSLTTFSSFSMEVVQLLQHGNYGLSLGVIAMHLIGSLLMTALGMLTLYCLSTAS